MPGIPECPRTRFPDGTCCGQYGWHAKDCPTQEPPEICRYCKRRIYFEMVAQGEWAHGSGSHYCQDDAGFTATPLHVATPVYHGKDDVL